MFEIFGKNCFQFFEGILSFKVCCGINSAYLAVYRYILVKSCFFLLSKKCDGCSNVWVLFIFCRWLVSLSSEWGKCSKSLSDFCSFRYFSFLKLQFQKTQFFNELEEDTEWFGETSHNSWANVQKNDCSVLDTVYILKFTVIQWIYFVRLNYIVDTPRFGRNKSEHYFNVSEISDFVEID